MVTKKDNYWYIEYTYFWCILNILFCHRDCFFLPKYDIRNYWIKRIFVSLSLSSIYAIFCSLASRSLSLSFSLSFSLSLSPCFLYLPHSFSLVLHTFFFIFQIRTLWQNTSRGTCWMTSTKVSKNSEQKWLLRSVETRVALLVN